MPTEELGQDAVYFVLAHAIFDRQTAVIGATDEVRPALDGAENFVVDIIQAQEFTVNLGFAGPLPEGFGGEVRGFLCD